MPIKSIHLLLIIFISPFVISAQTDSSDYKKIRVTGIPTLGYNNSFGLQIGALGMMMFDIKETDTISPASSIIGMGFYTTNETWFSLLASKLYWNNDNWRGITALGIGNINFQFYAEGLPVIGGTFIDYTTVARFAYIEVTRRTYKRLYVGANYMLNRMNTTFYLDDAINYNPDSSKVVSGVGVPLSWDSRDNVYNPKSGLNVNLRSLFYLEELCSDLAYNTLSLDINYYFTLSDQDVLASRATIYTGLGEVPFEGYRAIGRDDIRGYSQGKYRGDQIYSIQTEYRHSFKNRFGYVVFAGIASAKNSLNADNKWSGILPGVGAGLRFMAIKESKINLGIDVAVGKEDWGLYFRIGEVF